MVHQDPTYSCGALGKVGGGAIRRDELPGDELRERDLPPLLLLRLTVDPLLPKIDEKTDRDARPADATPLSTAFPTRYAPRFTVLVTVAQAENSIITTTATALTNTLDKNFISSRTCQIRFPVHPRLLEKSAFGDFSVRIELIRQVLRSLMGRRNDEDSLAWPVW